MSGIALFFSCASSLVPDCESVFSNPFSVPHDAALPYSSTNICFFCPVVCVLVYVSLAKRTWKQAMPRPPSPEIIQLSILFPFRPGLRRAAVLRPHARCLDFHNQDPLRIVPGEEGGGETGAMHRKCKFASSVFF